MSTVAQAQSTFLRLDDTWRTVLLAGLCAALSEKVLQAVDQREQGFGSAEAYSKLTGSVTDLFPQRMAGNSNPFREELVAKRLNALFETAERLGIGPKFQSMWDEAVANLRTDPLGPGANNNEGPPALAGITDRAKAQIARSMSRWPIPAGALAIPLICIGHGPDIAGMYHDREEVEDDLWTADGFEVVIAMEDHADPPRGKTLDFDGERFVLL